jgi:ADP-heptose:LPS heptosyltransferase
MAVDGLSINNLGMVRDVLPGELQQRAEETSAAMARLKKVEEAEKQKLDPDGKNKNQNQQQQQEEDESQEKTLTNLFQELSEGNKSDVEDYSKVINLTENKTEYRVMYNSYKEIVEIIHIKTGTVKETLTLEELKSFVMKVKNPLGIIVDKKI